MKLTPKDPSEAKQILLLLLILAVVIWLIPEPKNHGVGKRSMTDWKSFAVPVVAGERDEPGVYELANGDEMTVYIGSADRIRDRLWMHLGELPDSCIRRHAVKYRVDYTADYKNQELLMRSLFLDAFGQEPLCNRAGS